MRGMPPPSLFRPRRSPHARTSSSSPVATPALANALRMLLRRLISSEPRLGERIDVHSIPSIGVRLYRSQFGEPKLASWSDISHAIREAAAEVPEHKFSFRFLSTEWEQFVDAWQ